MAQRFWGGILALLLFVGCVTPAQPGPVTIAVATDLHELAPSLHDDGTAFRAFAATGAGRDIVHTEQILDAFERDLTALKPRWLLLTGDLTNNGEKDSHLALASRLGRIQATGTRVLVIPGNHDVSNPWARAFRGDKQLVASAVSPEDFAALYREFGYGSARSRDPGSLSYCVAAEPGLWFLMLDTADYDQNFLSGQPATGGFLSPRTLEWIRQQGAEAAQAGAKVVVAQHHNLFDHSEVIALGYTLDNADEARALYSDRGVRLVLSGHVHIQDIVRSRVDDHELYDVVTNALSVYPNQYGVITIDAGRTSAHYQTRRVDVDGWARVTGQTDPVLLDYASASEKSFAEGARKMGLRRLADMPADQASLAADAMALLNLHYFAGRQDLNGPVASSPGFRLLVESGGPFLSQYARSILNDDGTDDNDVTVDLR